MIEIVLGQRKKRLGRRWGIHEDPEDDKDRENPEKFDAEGRLLDRWWDPPGLYYVQHSDWDTMWLADKKFVSKTLKDNGVVGFEDELEAMCNKWKPEPSDYI